VETWRWAAARNGRVVINQHRGIGRALARAAGKGNTMRRNADHISNTTIEWNSLLHGTFNIGFDCAGGKWEAASCKELDLERQCACGVHHARCRIPLLAANLRAISSGSSTAKSNERAMKRINSCGAKRGGWHVGAPQAETRKTALNQGAAPAAAATMSQTVLHGAHIA
jgi:hypothetical protein